MSWHIIITFSFLWPYVILCPLLLSTWSTSAGVVFGEGVIYSGYKNVFGALFLKSGWVWVLVHLSTVTSHWPLTF